MSGCGSTRQKMLLLDQGSRVHMHILCIWLQLPVLVRRHLRRMMEGEGEEVRAQPCVARLEGEEQGQ